MVKKSKNARIDVGDVVTIRERIGTFLVKAITNQSAVVENQEGNEILCCITDLFCCLPIELGKTYLFQNDHKKGVCWNGLHTVTFINGKNFMLDDENDVSKETLRLSDFTHIVSIKSENIVYERK